MIGKMNPLSNSVSKLMWDKLNKITTVIKIQLPAKKHVEKCYYSSELRFY